MDVEHSRKQKKTVSSTDFAVQKIIKFQAIFSVELQAILKTAWGEAKIQNFSKIFFVLTIYICGDVQKSLQGDRKKK